ncbi:MAG: hypothetical protein AAB573_04515 [Patescibacteria group bacterium]
MAERIIVRPIEGRYPGNEYAAKRDGVEYVPACSVHRAMPIPSCDDVIIVDDVVGHQSYIVWLNNIQSVRVGKE